MTAIVLSVVVGEREDAVLVLEQHAALLGEPLGEALVRRGADHGVDLRRGVRDGVVEEADLEHRGQDVADHVVEARHWGLGPTARRP